jgi:hypothetical protein
MTYLESLQNFRFADSALKLLLVQLMPEKKVDAILVVEGEEDSNVYTRAINSFKPDARVEVIICNGKGGVLGLRDFIDDYYSHDNKTMFFIDKDHDDLLGIDYRDDKTYITDHYSIEWDVCTEQTITALIERSYALTEKDPIWKSVRLKFIEMSQEWLDYSKPIMQAVVVLREKGEKPKLDGIRFSDICRFQAGVMRRTNYKLETLLKASGCLCPDEKELSRCASKLDDIDERSYVRGKLAVEFCCAFLKDLNKICDYPTKIDRRPLQRKGNVGKSEFIQLAILDWTVPDSLQFFLRSWVSRQLV